MNIFLINISIVTKYIRNHKVIKKKDIFKFPISWRKE